MPARPSQTAHEAASIQTYARAAGVLFLVSLIAGGFGEAYVPNRILVAGDAAATAANLTSLDSLLRWGFVGYLFEGMADVGLAWLFYVLLRPVNRNLALLAAFFGLVGTAVFAGLEVLSAGVPMVLGNAGYLASFSPEQRNALAMLALRQYGHAAMLFTAFYGVGWIIRGYLIYRSEYLPRFLGVLLAIGGLGFALRNFALALTPQLPSGYLLFLLVPGGVILMGWLLFKGVDVARWEAKATP